MQTKTIDCLEQFGPLITKKKRLKILVGGRASTKTTFVADYMLSNMLHGKIICCAREFQNTIDESVHRTLCDEVDRLSLSGFSQTKNSLDHVSGGRSFYKGLARNITGIKGVLSGVFALWIEEGENLSDETLRVLTASLRLTAKQSQDYVDGKVSLDDLKFPEIWVTMNRRSRKDPVAERWLERAEPDLERCGYYEDDFMIVVQANYTDLPKRWWLGSGLETERAEDEQNLSEAEYNSKWHGHYLEGVENALIKREWFDAAIDLVDKLNIKPHGSKVTAYDPASTGDDAKAHASRHGIHFYDVSEIDIQDGNEALEFSTDFATDNNSDLYVWDGDGMGALIAPLVEKGLDKCDARMYNGSHGPDNPESIMEGIFNNLGKTNKELFYNKRAQFYTLLANRFYNAWLAVVKNKYINPDDLISISGNIKLLNKLRAEVCSIPTKPNGLGKIQLMTKDEMKKKYKIASPNMADCLAMAMEIPEERNFSRDLNFSGWG